MTIAVVLKGGLGNQLFQWALALELQHRGRQVVLDTRRVGSGRGLAIADVVNDMPMSNWPSFGWRFRNRLPFGLTPLGYRPVEEPSFRYWPDVLTGRLPRRALLHGYWQSPKYFPSVRKIVRRRILTAGIHALTKEGRDLRERILRTDSASVHLRRGDYANDPDVLRYHGVLADRFYHDALAQLRRDGCEEFLVFSDDLCAAKQLFTAPDCRVVPRSASTDAIGELALMASCRSHVIANSSFSWWGAWLNERAPTVVAPQDWFVRKDVNAIDLLPSHWSRLPGICRE